MINLVLLQQKNSICILIAMKYAAVMRMRIRYWVEFFKETGNLNLQTFRYLQIVIFIHAHVPLFCVVGNHAIRSSEVRSGETT